MLILRALIHRFTGHGWRQWETPRTKILRLKAPKLFHRDAWTRATITLWYDPIKRRFAFEKTTLAKTIQSLYNLASGFAAHRPVS